MLTGLELIGLALSIAPLLTEAIEHHQSRVVSFKAANKETHKKWTKEFFADLNYEICMLRGSLQKLVRGLSVDDETKTKLLDLENFDRELWRTPDPALQQCFNLRLSDFADSFAESLTIILKHLDKVIGDDTLPHPVAENNILIPGTTSFRRLEQLALVGKRPGIFARVKFGLKQDKRLKWLQMVAKHNERLERMLKQGSEAPAVNPLPASRVRESAMPHSQLRDHMDDLWRAMKTLWSQCSCLGHEVQFGLLKSTEETNLVSFDMLTKFAHDKTGGRFHWGESKIQIALQEHSPKKTSQVSFAAIDEPRTPTECPQASFAEVDGSRAIPIQRMRSMSGTTVYSASPTSSLLSTPPSSPPILDEVRKTKPGSPGTRKRITSICETIRSGLRQQACSLIMYDDGELWHTASSKRQEVEASHPGVTLASLLGQKLSLKNKKTLSLTLAASLLHFPWQDHAINKDSISFFDLDLSKPFTDLSLEEKSADEDPDANFMICPNRSLLALATMILELELGQKIESFYLEDDLFDGEPNVNTDFFTANRLLKEKNDDLYDGVREAIDACLSCNFGVESLSLDDSDFRQAAYERIVLPLEEELDRGFGMSSQPLGLDERRSLSIPQIQMPQKRARFMES